MSLENAPEEFLKSYIANKGGNPAAFPDKPSLVAEATRLHYLSTTAVSMSAAPTSQAATTYPPAGSAPYGVPQTPTSQQPPQSGYVAQTPTSQQPQQSGYPPHNGQVANSQVPASYAYHGYQGGMPGNPTVQVSGYPSPAGQISGYPSAPTPENAAQTAAARPSAPVAPSAGSATQPVAGYPTSAMPGSGDPGMTPTQTTGAQVSGYPTQMTAQVSGYPPAFAGQPTGMPGVGYPGTGATTAATSGGVAPAVSYYPNAAGAQVPTSGPQLSGGQAAGGRSQSTGVQAYTVQGYPGQPGVGQVPIMSGYPGQQAQGQVPGQPAPGQMQGQAPGGKVQGPMQGQVQGAAVSGYPGPSGYPGAMQGQATASVPGTNAANGPQLTSVQAPQGGYPQQQQPTSLYSQGGPVTQGAPASVAAAAGPYTQQPGQVASQPYSHHQQLQSYGHVQQLQASNPQVPGGAYVAQQAPAQTIPQQQPVQYGQPGLYAQQYQQYPGAGAGYAGQPAQTGYVPGAFPGQARTQGPQGQGMGAMPGQVYAQMVPVSGAFPGGYAGQGYPAAGGYQMPGMAYGAGAAFPQQGTYAMAPPQGVGMGYPGQQQPAYPPSAGYAPQPGAFGGYPPGAGGNPYGNPGAQGGGYGQYSGAEF